MVSYVAPPTMPPIAGPTPKKRAFARPKANVRRCCGTEAVNRSTCAVMLQSIVMPWRSSMGRTAPMLEEEIRE
eukprot:4738062-Prymnesium_polylepis.1